MRFGGSWISFGLTETARALKVRAEQIHAAERARETVGA
jgi:hypothetical protein